MPKEKSLQKVQMTAHYYMKTLLHEEGFARRKKVSGGTEERNPNEETVGVNTVSTNVPQKKSENILLQTILPVIVIQGVRASQLKHTPFTIMEVLAVFSP